MEVPISIEQAHPVGSLFGSAARKKERTVRTLTVRHTRRLLCLNSGGGVVHLLRKERKRFRREFEGERGKAQTNRASLTPITNLNFSAFDNIGVKCLPRRVCVRTVCECHEAESLRTKTKVLSLLGNSSAVFVCQRGRVEIELKYYIRFCIANELRVAGFYILETLRCTMTYSSALLVTINRPWAESR